MICLPSLEFSSIWGSPSIIVTYSGPIFCAKSSACLMSTSSVLGSFFCTASAICGSSFVAISQYC